MKFKYQTSFSSNLLKVQPLFEVEGFSYGSLENLRTLIPNSELDFNENIDLLGIAFNAAVINKFNKNDDGINTETALKIVNLFKHKPTNIEHKKEKVVGHILTAGFSSYGDNRILTPSELANYNDPFNIALGAVVYKFVNKEFAAALEASSSDESSPYYKKISASWELGFNDFNIAIGSSNLKEAEIITDEKHISELKSKLKCYGGSGELEDGTKIYRLVVGEIFPLGIGFTTNPAADVNGVIADKGDEQVFLEEPKAKVYKYKSHFFTKKNSHLQNNDVNSQKESVMNLESVILEVKEALIEKKISQEAAANMTATFTEAIKKRDEQYRKDMDDAKAATEAIEKEKQELKASMQEVQTQLSQALQKIQEFENARKAAEALAKFNSRMEEIDQIFELDDEDRQVLADDIKSLETDESFASYKNKLGVMWKNKNKKAKEEKEKEAKAAIEEEVQRRISELQKSSTASSVEDVLENVKPLTAAIPNNNEQSSKPAQSFLEKFASAFKKENILIS